MRAPHQLPSGRQLPALLYSVLLPFEGLEVAGAEYRRAVASAEARAVAPAS